MQKLSLAADFRAATAGPPHPGSADALSGLVETALGIARRLRPAEEAVSLIQAAVPAGVFRDSTADLDDTPDLYLYALSAAARLALGAEDPAAALLERLGPDRVVSPLARLAEDYRLVCSCCFLAALTYEEMARVLGYPVGTVRARPHRGRRLLQKSLSQDAQDEEIIPKDREATT